MREVQKAYRARLKRSHPAEDYVAAEVLNGRVSGLLKVVCAIVSDPHQAINK